MMKRMIMDNGRIISNLQTNKNKNKKLDSGGTNHKELAAAARSVIMNCRF